MGSEWGIRLLYGGVAILGIAAWIYGSYRVSLWELRTGKKLNPNIKPMFYCGCGLALCLATIIAAPMLILVVAPILVIVLRLSFLSFAVGVGVDHANKKAERRRYRRNEARKMN